MLKSNESNSQFIPNITVDHSEKHKARQLHASVYLRKGFVDNWEVTEDGVIHDDHDPHHHHSRYFTIKKSSSKDEVLATARQITTATGRFSDLPMYKHSRITEEARDKINLFSPKKTVEISALVKHGSVSPYATLLLYRLMWQYSYKNGDELWLMACSPELYRRLKFLFGETIVQIGERTPYKGEDVIPVMLEVKKSVEHLKSSLRSRNLINRSLKRNMLKFFLEGM